MIDHILSFCNKELKPEYTDTIKRSVLIYGSERQLLCFVEELGELLEEILEYDGGVILPGSGMMTEIADVIVATETIRVMYHMPNSDFDSLKPSVGGSVQYCIAKMLIGISHFERDRIEETEFCQLIFNLYHSLKCLPFQREDLLEELDKKFIKFATQIRIK